jgi:hypothetical protein
MKMSSSAFAAPGTSAGSYISDHDAILAVMDRYNDAVRTGNSVVMKPVFHENATFFGYYEGKLLAVPIQMLFDWVDANGPSPDIEARFASIDIVGSIGVVRLEMENLTGKLAGTTGARLSDLFQLIRIEGKWTISQKSFHWHVK